MTTSCLPCPEWQRVVYNAQNDKELFTMLKMAKIEHDQSGKDLFTMPRLEHDHAQERQWIFC